MDARPRRAKEANERALPPGGRSELSAACGAELLRQGDARAAVDDWIGAVELWRAAGRDGAEEAARARLQRVRERFGTERVSEGGVPRRALQPLAICLEAAVLGVLAFVAADRGRSGIDPVLLAMGWVGMAIAAGGALVFALRSGRLDGSAAPAVVAATGSLEDLGVRAADAARRSQRIGVSPLSPDAGNPSTTIAIAREPMTNPASDGSERTP